MKFVAIGMIAIILVGIMIWRYMKFRRANLLPKQVGCTNWEGNFCICDDKGAPQFGCKTCVPHNLQRIGGNLKKSVEYGLGGKYKYIGVASLPQSKERPDDGFLFGFNEILQGNYKPYDNVGCNVPCHNNSGKKCGCAESSCPPEAKTQRAWQMYETGYGA